jgi:hypothetical protein
MSGEQHLFSVTRWLLRAGTVFCIFLIVVLGLCLSLTMMIATDIGARMGVPADLGGVSRVNAGVVASFAVACGLIAVILVVLMLRAAAQIVHTAIGGDPFVADNARRLMRIGWLLAALEATGILAPSLLRHLVVRLVPPNLREQVHFNFGFDMWPVGVIAILMIFVLAQIFRRGSEMRAELEATV